MTLYSFIHLSISFFYCWINAWSLSYIGVFLVSLSGLLYCAFLVWWELYTIWLYGLVFDYLSFMWVELGNNMYVFWNFKNDFFGVLLSFIMLSGGFFVVLFVFIDMWDDKEGSSFVVNLGFFMSFMLIVANAGNLVLFYLGWEGIGLTSLFLINFWTDRVRGIKASFKVFVINKIGDFFVLILLSVLAALIGDWDFDVINALTPVLLNFNYYIGSYSFSASELLGIILLFGGCVKSAQYGFHIWLLEAMEAPLGASALMHSSTLVVAGLVLIFKLSSLLEISGWAQILMFSMGVFSATAGALIACFQYELKVIMAYSTISNMGYMFTLCSVGAYYETTVLMVLHAYIKIFMFLVVGAIMLHCNGCQDIRWMGGLLLYTPVLWVSYVSGGLCLIGLPYWSGYYCKNFIAKVVWESGPLLKGGEFILLISYLLTFFYVSRVGYLVFLGPKNGHRKIYRLKPTSLAVTCGLTILAIIILFGGFYWVNLIDLSITSLGGGVFYKSFYFFQYITYELPAPVLYLWLIIYFITVAVVFGWSLINRPFNWGYLVYWYISLSVITGTFFYFVVICPLIGPSHIFLLCRGTLI